MASSDSPSNTVNPPDGFVLDNNSSAPPEGFQLDKSTSATSLPEGFVVDKPEEPAEPLSGDESYLAATGRYEEQNLKSSWQDFNSSLKNGLQPSTEPHGILEGGSAETEKALQQDNFKPDQSAGPLWLQRVGEAGTPLIAAGTAVASPFISMMQGGAKEIIKQGDEPEERAMMPQEELQKEDVFSQAAGAAVAGVSMAAAPLLGEIPKKPIIDRSRPPILDSEFAKQQNAAQDTTQQEALANLSMSAKQPWKKTEDIAAATLANAKTPRSLEEINADINTYAANTERLGYKETLAKLQQEKQDVLKPQNIVDNVARTSNGEITDEQFHANIKQPTDAALEAGVPVERVRSELEASIPKTFDDTYRQSLIDRAIPARDQNIAKTAPEVAKATGETVEVVQALTLPKDQLGPDATAPNVVKQTLENPTQLDVLGTKKALGSNPIVRAAKGMYNSLFNEYTVLDNLNRAWAKANDIDIGRNDLLETSDTALIKNLSQRGGYRFQSFLGDIEGQNRHIWRVKPGTSELVKDETLLPYTTIKREAVEGGLNSETLNKINLARNALDDYANLDRVSKESLDAITKNKEQIAQLKAHQELPEAQGFFERYKLQNRINSLEAENASHQKALKELGKRETYMPRNEAVSQMARYKNNQVAQGYIDNLNKLHGALLDDLVTSGRITQEVADRLRVAHPNYVPAWRTVDDYSFDLPRQGYFSSPTKAFLRRDIGKRGASQIDIEDNIIRNIIGTVKKTDAAQVKSAIFNNLYHTLNPTDDAWELMFREPKADVTKALQRLANGKAEALSAEEVTPIDPSRIENYDKVTFDINGKQLQLSVVDKNLFNSISNAYKHFEEHNPLVKASIFLARMKRDFLIKYDPTFAVRNAKRGVMDFMVNSRKVTPFIDYTPGISQAKTIADTFLDKEFYDYYSMNYGFGNQLSTSYENMSMNNIVKNIKAGTHPSGILHGLKDGLGQLNNRVDAGTRILQFKVIQAKLINEGYSPERAYEAAMFTSKDVHLNFAQKGSSSTFNTLLQTIPLSRTFLNAVDKSLRMGINAPARWATGSLSLYAMYRAVKVYNSLYADENGISPQEKLDENIQKEVMPIYYGKGVNQYIPWNLGWVWGRSMPAWDKTFTYTQQKLGQFFDKTGEVAGDNAIKNIPELAGRITGKELFTAWTDWTFGVATPSSALPFPFSAAVGLAQNQDNLGRPIVPQTLSDKGAPEFSQYFVNKTDPGVIDFTRDLYTKHGVQLSPAKVEYLTREFTGALGGAALIAGGRLYGAMSGKEYPSLERGNIPGFSLISGNNSDVPHEGVELQYSNVWKKLQPIAEQDIILKTQAANYPEIAPKYQEFVQEHATELAYVHQFQAANAELVKLRKGYEQIIAAKRDEAKGVQDIEPSVFGDTTKRTKINDLKENMIAIQKGVLTNLQRDLDNDNNPTNDIYYQRHTRNPVSEGLENLFPSENPKKPLDKTDEKSDNSSVLDFSKGANMHAQEPPAITQEAPQEIQDNYNPDFFASFLPNLRKGMVSMYRDNIIDYTIKQEGGDKFTETPGDRGGATKFGITLRTLQEGNPNATANDVKALTATQAKNIYVKNYWDKGRVGDMPIGLQDVIFDMNVNTGLAGSTIIVQRALNSLGADIDEDGKIGNNTLNALNDFKTGDIRQAITQERIKWYEDIVKNDPSQAKFLHNWRNRASNMESIPEEIKAA